MSARYRLVEKIGQGGMATVWRADDLALGRQVAIKVLLSFVAERTDSAERFEREARALAGIRHANVLQLYDYLPAEADEPARLVMELLSGPPLHRFVVERGTPLPEVAALIVAEVAAGLVAVHARGIVHRDVKPENIILDEGRVVLTDFGVARVAVQERSALTQTGAIIGSPTYMSPEQARGEEIDARSDQFALGSMLYFLCTGAAPFSGAHPLVVMQRIDRGEYLPPGAKNPRVPTWLERLIKKSLQRSAEARFADMIALLAALRAGLADDGLTEPTVEVRRYFADPQAYNEELDERLVRHRLADAERAWQRGERARALSSVGRVLQIDARHERALALLQLLSRAGARRWMALAALAVIVVAGLGAVPLRAWLRHRAAEPALVTTAVVALDPVALPAELPPDLSSSPPAPSSPAVVKLGRPRLRPIVANPGPPAAPVVPAAAADVPAQERVVAPARLSVRTAPWCELTVDGKHLGRTPQTLTLEGGRHALHCVSASGAILDRSFELVAGEHRVVEERLVATAELRPKLTRGDTVRVDDDDIGPGGHTASVGRHRVTLLKDGAIIDTRWVDLPPTGCRLLDAPELHCEHP